jgi:uncharacterized ubiquitin-like protein YukD
MQQTLLVTVQGTQRRLDVELPADVPVGELIPLLMEMCNQPMEFGANQSRSPWTLYVTNLNQPLGATQTLAEGGVLDGDILLLQAPGTVIGETREKGAPRPIAASPQSGMIGVSWEKSWTF